MPSPLRRLHDKLCRELAQAEQSAATHCAREARRYGAYPPGRALLAISHHALAMRPELRFLAEVDQPLGARVGRSVGEALSALRQLVIDRVVDAERSYRATLLGVRHGVDVARVLREIFAQQQDASAMRTCDQLIDQRVRLVAEAELRLTWFARNPEIALRSATALARTRPLPTHP